MARPSLPPTSASSFLRAAVGHHQAANQVQKGIKDSAGRFNATFFAYYNLVGFCIELYLKSYLSNNGRTVDELARFGHRLRDLLSDAASRGLFSYSGVGIVDPSALHRIVNIVDPHFSSNTYRYIDDSNDRYTYIENSELMDTILLDLRVRIERSGIVSISS